MREAAVPVVTIRLTPQAQEQAPPVRRAGLWWRWTRAVTLGEIAGFSVPAVVAALALGAGPLAQLAVILLAGIAEGAILGLAQAYALRTALPTIATRDWVRATAGGAAIAWTVGALPIMLGESLLRWPPAVLALLAMTLLAAMGLLQWRLLRQHARRAWWWVPATAGSWLAALAAFALVTSPLWQEGQPVFLVIAIGVLGGSVMAFTVAALTGAALVGLLARPGRAVPPTPTQVSGTR